MIMQTKIDTRLLILLSLLLVVVQTVKIRAHSPTPDLLQTDISYNSIIVKQIISDSLVRVSFRGQEVELVESSPEESVLYKIYDYRKIPQVFPRRPRASGVIGEFVTIYWILLILPNQQEEMSPQEWLQETHFSDSSEVELLNWYNSRDEKDEYTVLMLDVQIPQWKDDSQTDSVK